MRIVHLSDLHFERMPPRLFDGVPESLYRAKRIVRSLSPDFVIVSGDLTSYGCWDVRELYAVKDWLDGLAIPYLAVPGNHDLSANAAKGAAYPVMEHFEDVPFGKTHFGSVFGPSPVTVVEFPELTIVGFGIRDGDPDGTLALVQDALDGARSPVLTVGHYPLEPVRDRGFLAEFGSAGYLDAVQPMVHAMVADSPHVIAHLCGHVHVASVRMVGGGLPQFSAGAAGPGASRGWIFDTHESGLHFESFDAGGPELFWPQNLLGDHDIYDAHWEVSARRQGSLFYSMDGPAMPRLDFGEANVET